MEQDNTPQIRIPAATFCAFTPLVVATRFWSRRQTKAALGGDDWIIFGCNGKAPPDAFTRQ